MKKLFPAMLLILGAIIIIDLFYPGLPITHDGQDHVARIANFYLNLEQGNIIPRWAANLNWGYGHPILEFLYPLPSYLASLFHFLHFDLIDSVKIVFALGVVLSGAFMYLWLSQFLAIESAFVGGVLYMFAPYRFVDLYVRGDIGENLAFVFMPLALYFIYKLSKNISTKNTTGISISLALLILSHNAISLIYIPFIVFYGIFLGRDRKYLVNFISSFILGFALSAFFWVPGLFESKYTLRNVVTKGGYITRFITFGQLIYGPWSYGGSGQFTVQLGIFHWTALLVSSVSIIFAVLRKKKNILLPAALIAYTAVAIFVMLPYADFIWSRVLLLQNFQFPWRFLAIPVFSCSTLAALMFEKIPKKIQTIAVTIFVVLILLISKDYWHANGYLQKNDNAFTGIYNSTTDTGESAPIWSVRFMERRAKAPAEVISGKASFTPLQRLATKHTYEIVAQTKASIRENTIYFPGWEVLVDGSPAQIQFQDENSRGLITFNIEPGKHNVEVRYSETKLRLISDIVSAAALILILSYNVWSKKI